MRLQSQPFEDLPKVCSLSLAIALPCHLSRLPLSSIPPCAVLALCPSFVLCSRVCTALLTTCALSQEGSVVLALHRSARSDLFFEGFVTDSGTASYCKVKFTEGRGKGHTIKVCAFLCVRVFVPVRLVKMFEPAGK